MKIEWAYAGGLVFFLVSAWAVTQVLGFGGEKASLAFYWLSALGITGTAFIYFFQEKWSARKARGSGESSDTPAAPAAGGGGTEVEQLVRDAEARFAASRVAQSTGQGGARLTGMPLLFVVGEQGSTKTTVIQNSGMEAELLAGQVQGNDNAVVPTRSANLWFARKAIFVEAGGRLWSDADGWSRLLKRLTPSRLKSAVGGGGQAPRAVILCVDVEKFQQPGASEAMSSAARSAQTRLQEISQKFGISFPVYVLFTRCDRLPFFLDYVRNLSSDEATQVLGATLPIGSFDGGVFAQQQTQRLGEACEEIFYSLADKRIEFLPRENDGEKLPPVYEFPREFRKLRNLIVPFLVDVCRPSQLTTTPFLRGFYFCGVRPVVVADVAPAPMARPVERPAAGIGATSLFNVREHAPSMPAAQPLSGGRKIPQWIFLTRLFNEIILEDKAAMGASGPSTQASTLRRVLLGVAGGLALLWAILATVSFFQNKGLEGDVLEATERIKAVRLAPASLPAVEDLKRLDGLRQKLEQLTQWRREGAPWSYRWGLYTGNDLLPLVRKAYYQSFNQLLFRETQQDRMLSYLRNRPPQARPEEDYNYGYHTLRSYRLTTNEWKRTEDNRERDYLAPQLRERWLENHREGVDQERRALAEKQFEFYSGDLRNGNPFSDREDGESVNTARVWLGSFPLLDSRYNSMLDAAEKKAKKVNYNRDFAGTAAVVINNRDVRGAFTKEGWAAMQAIFKSPNFAESEQWVLPDSFKRSKESPADMLAQIRDRYVADYIKRWRDYFNTDTNVLGYSNLPDAVNKLKEHSGVRPAVLYLIGMASANTAPEPASDPMAQKVRNAFQWSHNVVPPGAFIVPGKNDIYVTALAELQMSAEAVVKDLANNQALTTAESSKTKAQMSAQTLGRPLAPDPEGNLDRAILAILIKPTQLTFPEPIRGENQAGAAMCAQFNLIKRKFPFDPGAREDVPLDELDGFLKPGSGTIWQLYESSLKNSVMRLGNQFQANPSANPPVNPDFIRFFNQLASLSAAFYPGGQGPRLNYSVQLSEVELLLGGGGKAKSGSILIDGKKAELGKAPQNLVWTGAAGHSVTFEYNDTPSFARTDMWAIFRFFVDATVTPGPGGYLVTWPLKGGAANNTIANARFNVNLGGAPAVFDRRFMAGMRCIAQVVK